MISTSAFGPTAVGGERGVPHPQAMAAVMRAVRALGLRPRWQEWGRPGPQADDEPPDGPHSGPAPEHGPATEHRPTAWVCSLRDRGGNAAPHAFGTGKGSRTEGRLGALGEAAERVVSGPAFFDRRRIRLRPAAQIAAGELAAEAVAPTLESMGTSRLACWTYTEAAGGGRSLDAPVFLSAPWYAARGGTTLRQAADDRSDYGALCRYAADSGYALGIGETEALVNALNETIERDACSLLLVRAFLSDGHPLTCLDPESLPVGLARLHAHVQQRTGARVRLLDATATDLDVPTVVAYSPPQETGGRRRHLRGQGTSLSPRYAVYRALTELLEDHLVGEHPGSTRHAPAGELSALHRCPALRTCGCFDLTVPLRRATLVPFTDRPSPAAPHAHAEALLAHLGSAGFTAYSRRVGVLPGNVAVVHALVPGLERFFAVVNGALVLPGPRARSLHPRPGTPQRAT